MKRIKPILIIFCAIVGIINIQSCQSTKSSATAKLLKFNFEKGKGYDYEMTMSMDQEVKGQPIQMDVTTYYSMDVSTEEGTDKTIISQIDRFKMKMGVMGMSLDIDTDNPLPSLGLTEDGKDPMKMINSLFGAIKGQRFTMKVNEEGKVLEVKGFEDMARRIVDSLGLDEKEKAQMTQQFNTQFNDDKMKEQFERAWYIFPNKEVKVGDKWKKNSQSGFGGIKGNYTSTYEVTEIEGDMVTLKETTEIESERVGMQMTGSIKGTIVVDSRVGLIVSADEDLKMSSKDDEKDNEMKAKIKIKGKAR